MIKAVSTILNIYLDSNTNKNVGALKGKTLGVMGYKLLIIKFIIFSISCFIGAFLITLYYGYPSVFTCVAMGIICLEITNLLTDYFSKITD